MQKFELVQMTTPSGLIHQGVVFKPTQTSKIALVWIHGLTSTFYSNLVLLNAFTKGCEEARFGFASFNNRGHDSITEIDKVDASSKKGYTYVNGGAGYDVFEDCVDDIEGSINFLEKEGFKEVILIGHSSGTNKAVYYQAEKNDPRVKGIVLLSALSDRLVASKEESFSSNIDLMKELIETGRGDTLVMGKMFFPLTPKRYLSLFTPGPEDQFDYGDEEPQLPFFSRMKTPSLLIYGGADEYMDRPAEKIIEVFKEKAQSTCSSIIIPEGTHGFTGKEKEVVGEVVKWINGL